MIVISTARTSIAAMAMGHRVRRFLAGTFAPILVVGYAAAQTPNYFGGYRCVESCRGHVDGFVWAREHRIRDAAQCAGPRPSHVQGCIVYLRDRMRDPRMDDNGAPIR